MAIFSNTIEAASWLDDWSYPEFDPDQSAIYYARVLEIPTASWNTYLSVKNGLPQATVEPATLQERMGINGLLHPMSMLVN